MCGGEKVWIARKSWNRSKKLADQAKKPRAEYDLQLIQYYVKQPADQPAYGQFSLTW